MLSTAWKVIAPMQYALMLEDNNAWAATHQNHPCTVWTREHKNNYAWLASLGLALCKEFEVRFSGQPHSAKKQLLYLAAHVPPIVSATEHQLVFDGLITMPPQCMPEEFHIPGDPVAAYRLYYQSENKAKLRWWRPKTAPIEIQLEEFTPEWFSAKPLAAPKYYTNKIAQQERKRKREQEH